MFTFFSQLLDALLPEPADKKALRNLAESEFESLTKPYDTGEGWITALFPYRDARVRAVVRAIKYHGEMRLLKTAGNALAEHALDLLSERAVLEGWRRPLLIPIPAAPVRLRERGYNQAARIALAMLPTLSDTVVYTDTALKRRNRVSQVTLSRAERHRNVADAFFVSEPETIRGQCVILIDDVTESGATLCDARRALREAGAADVAALVIAH